MSADDHGDVMIRGEGGQLTFTADGRWIWVDQFGDQYQLVPTGLPRDPLRITPIRFNNGGK